MMYKRILTIAAGIVISATTISVAKVTLPACFTDNMVLQQKANVGLWGTAKPATKLTVSPSWGKKKYTVETDKNGSWTLKIGTPAFGGPYTITFDDGEATTLNNVLIGEVWVCSGQSNMEMTPTGMYGDIVNLPEETAAANYPAIRMLKIENRTALQPQKDVVTRGAWQACTPETFKQFSAVAYFFARELQKDLHVPIGIINTTWGGTIADAWTSGDALKSMPAFTAKVKEMEVGPTQEQQNTQYQKDIQQWINTLSSKDPLYANGKLPWLDNSFNDKSWKTLQMPGFWEKQGLPNFDGAVALRKVINVPAAWAGKDLVLNIRAIDDFDMTWFNGNEIGHKEVFFDQRTYTVPGALVKAGPNVIAIRVVDTGGDGGIAAGDMNLALSGNASEKIDIAGDWKYMVLNKLAELPNLPQQPTGPNRPTVLYNAMVNPIINYTIKGVIWYQGESNADRAYQYRTLFPLMISNWRDKWHEGNFPFYFVQLAAFMPKEQQPNESAWAELREAQAMTLKVPNTGMAVAIDIGDQYNIHPANKQEVGRRLSLIARAKTYGESVFFSGPEYKSVKFENGKAIVTFDYADGLKAKGDKVTGFALAGADHKFYWADAKIENGKVIVSSDQVPDPEAVRYGWANYPECNLYNIVDLPASPFRTDDWKGITYGKE